jgi:hypothetical protein
MRVIMDTNLWSSIGDEGVADKFDQLLVSRGITMVVPPSYLVEVVRLPRTEPRGRIIHSMASGRRHRLKTEAALESQEVVSEVKRCHPDWLRRFPDSARVASLNNFWTNLVWRQALEDSSQLHRYEESKHQVHDYMVATQREDRSELLKVNFTIRPLTSLRAHMD